jgi:hypothetical protein
MKIQSIDGCTAAEKEEEEEEEEDVHPPPPFYLFNYSVDFMSHE